MSGHRSRRGRGAAGWLALATLVILVAGLGVVVDRAATEAPPEPTPTPTPAPDEPTEGAVDLAAQVEEIAAVIESMRELSFEETPEPQLITREEVAAQIAAELEEEYPAEDAELDRRLLAALGAVPADADLREMLRDTLSEQVAGRYDPETGELTVVAEPDDEPLGPLDQVTLAHELGHAIVDQRIGLPDLGDDDDYGEGREDAARAAQAVVEGDATLLMVLYAQQHLTAEEQARLAEEHRELAGEADALDALPHYLRRALLFPYEEGTVFAAQVSQQRGWEAMDEALAEPPETTLEILEPERYLAADDGPDEVRDAPDPAGEWERATQRSFGASDLLFLFEAPGDDAQAALSEPVERATAWRGGEVVLWGDGERDALAVLLAGGEGLCDSVATWYAAAFPDAEERDDAEATTWHEADRVAHLACEDDEVRLGIGPDVEVARSVAR